MSEISRIKGILSVNADNGTTRGYSYNGRSCRPEIDQKEAKEIGLSRKRNNPGLKKFTTNGIFYAGCVMGRIRKSDSIHTNRFH